HYRGPALNEAVGAEVPDPMVDMFVGDITDGIAGTGVRAGLLKCAIDDEGVDPRRVVLGHSGDSTDADHLTELAEAGFVLGMDRFGINLDTTFEARADIVVEMCRRGFAGQMVLSQDASCYIDWLAPGVMAMLTEWRYTHIHEDVLPYLREHGVTDEQIDTMLVSNPRR